jgi:hypothetical protein
MRAAALLRSLAHHVARDWARGARFCLALFACLNLLSATALRRLAPNVAAFFSGYRTSGFAPAPFDTVHATVIALRVPAAVAHFPI